MDDRLTLVMAEDNYLVREGTSRLLEETGSVRVLAAVGTAPELLDAVERLRPAAVMTDIRMPPGHHLEGIQAAHTIRARHPEIGVVVLSQHADELYAFELFKGGTERLAYLLKDRVASPNKLVDALREVAAGRSVVDAEVVAALVAARAHRARSPLAQLTPRELDVLREMAEGKTNLAISRSLFLSESAVEKYASAVFAKLSLTEEPALHRRVAAVLAFLEDDGRGFTQGRGPSPGSSHQVPKGNRRSR